MGVDLVFTVAPAEVKLRPTFWFEEQVRLFNVLYPLLRRTILDAAKAALEDLLEMGVGIEWDLVNTQVVRWIHDYVTDLSSGITSTSSRYVQEAVADWIGSGQHLDELVDTLQPMFGEVRARLIATTEVTRAYSEGNQATWRASGVVDGKRWNTAVDELVCPICEPLDGMEIGLEEDGFTTEAGDIGLTGPPAHVNCILPGNIVAIPGEVLAATKSFYSGRCIEITLANGCQITVTENHPILADDRWVAAQFLSEGNYIFSTTDAQRISATINPHNDNIPASIEQIFTSYKMSGKVFPGRVPISSVDFHGDGRKIVNGNIEIIYSDRLLNSNAKSAFFEHSTKGKLSRNNTGQGNFMSFGAPHLFDGGNNPALISQVSSLDLVNPLLGGHRSPLDTLGLGLIAGSYTGIQEALSESPAIDTSLASEFVLTFAELVSLEKIIKIRDFDYSGHVYDLQVNPYELYITNGIIAHNCRCWLSPVVKA